MSTWFSRLASRLVTFADPDNGPWNRCLRAVADPQRMDFDADLRRMHRDVDAIRVRFAEPR
ncbi:MAG: hypothetical protein KDB50_11965 [Mycobacterium sp.]|nr:hypothetical protein [Mycobacterium sp.]